jgi:hypothetical protein
MAQHSTSQPHTPELLPNIHPRASPKSRCRPASQLLLLLSRRTRSPKHRSALPEPLKPKIHLSIQRSAARPTASPAAMRSQIAGHLRSFRRPPRTRPQSRRSLASMCKSPEPTKPPCESKPTKTGILKMSNRPLPTSRHLPRSLLTSPMCCHLQDRPLRRC